MGEKFLRSTALLKEQIKTDEHNPVPHMYLGVSYLGKSMYDEAIAESKKALELAKKKKFTLRDFLVSYYVISAAYLKKGNSKESEKYALKSIEIDDQFIDGFCILSFIYYDSKEYDRFLQTSENYLNSWDTITTHPGKSNTFTSHTIGHKWKIHLLRGFYHLSSGQDEKGETEIDTALKESAEIEECLRLLGNFHMENNNLDKAEETYKKLLDINETAVDVLVKTGHVKFKKGDLQETVLFWKKAVDIEPTLFDIRLLICKVNIIQGKFEDVIADCDRLLHILSIPGNITLEDLSDLANLFNIIGEKLKEKHDAKAAETAFNICKDLKRIESMDTANVQA
jgi:tetratricopeptide (TPR) repeat protein